MDDGPRRAALVLAAGRATRFGATKQLAEVDGRPLVAHVVAAAIGAALDRVVVVVGHDGVAVTDAVTAAANACAAAVTVVDNPDHVAGQATSLARGIEAVGDADVAVVLLGDEPDVDTRVVARVAAAVIGPDVPVARVAYRDGPGHPVAFHRSLFAELRAVTGDRGARDVVARHRVAEVTVDAPRPRDVDTPADLEALDR